MRAGDWGRKSDNFRSCRGSELRAHPPGSYWDKTELNVGAMITSGNLTTVLVGFKESQKKKRRKPERSDP